VSSSLDNYSKYFNIAIYIYIYKYIYIYRERERERETDRQTERGERKKDRQFRQTVYLFLGLPKLINLERISVIGHWSNIGQRQ
jgi:hypothetical protein